MMEMYQNNDRVEILRGKQNELEMEITNWMKWNHIRWESECK